MQSVTDGLIVWATAVVPALLPFFVLSKLLAELDFFSHFCRYISPITKKLFNAPAISGYIFLMSIISGYPVGAKLIQEYHKNNLLTKNQCRKISTFTSTSGPLFIIGTVAGGFFNDRKLGFILIGCHVLSAIICGILLKNFYCCDDNTTAVKNQEFINKNILNDTIYSAISGILSIGVFISLFFMLADMLPINKISNPVLQVFVTGLLEVTHGCQMMSTQNLPFVTTATLCQTMISFGGLCIALQSYSYLKECGISFVQIIFNKALQASVATVLTFAICLLF
ncbi:MAG: hypothetical protein E7344_04730 [Clostridiales bacterium]|nr:hypothetical protein [Clostridiales bacterium]